MTSAAGLPDDTRWRITVDGQPVVADSVSMVNEDMGLTMGYGRVGGARYAQGVLEKPGGATVIPYCQHSEHGLLVGVVVQPRPLQLRDQPGTNGSVLNCPRGFRRPKDKFSETAEKEFHEEFGENLRGRVEKMDGPLVHMDNALITYSTGQAGDAFYRLSFSEEDIEVRDGEFVLREGIIESPDPTDEKILGSRFVKAEWLLMEVADAYSRLALLHLLAHLGRINLS